MLRITRTIHFLIISNGDFPQQVPFDGKTLIGLQCNYYGYYSCFWARVVSFLENPLFYGIIYDMKKKKVIVAMSGGVDSSVSAALLKKQGFDVVGMYMKCWSEGEQCSTIEDERMARLAASVIGIPFYTIDLIKEYKDKVISYLLKGYKEGITPNPDIMCNKEVKFGLFFKRAMDMGADFVATGHYANIQDGQLYAGKDTNKDQSYFLSFINPELLSKIIFPIGGYKKKEVRKMARAFQLPTAERPDSQGLCFVGKVDFADFLKTYIAKKRGKIVDTTGNVLGEHDGAFAYTIGQRKGLGLSGGPYFVVAKHVKDNVVVVSRNEKDLEQKEAVLQDMNWFSKPKDSSIVQAKIRYRQKAVPSRLFLDKDGSFRLVFKDPQRAVTPGQMAVLYDGDKVIAGGVIQ